MRERASSHATVLFLCTGNYYRSRYAELYFNARATERGLPWRAESRGLQLYPGNEGGVSTDTLRRLAQLGIEVAAPQRLPLRVTEDDLQAAALVVAVKEAEHRPLLERDFPAWTEQVEYWHIHDIDFAHPDEALPELHALVESLLERLQAAAAAE